MREMQASPVAGATGTTDGVLLDLALVPSARAVSAARHAVSSLEPYLEPDVFENLRLLVSELVATSVHDGSFPPGATIRLRVVESRWCIRAEVANPARRLVVADGRPPSDDIEAWGRTLLLDGLARRWGSIGNDATELWFELDRHPRP